jgi:hypothetical protein
MFARRVVARDPNARAVLSEHEATSQFESDKVATCVPSGRRGASKIYMANQAVADQLRGLTIVIGNFPPNGPGCIGGVLPIVGWTPCISLAKRLSLD